MPKYRKKPVVIEAVQLRWDTWNEMCEHAGVGSLEDGKPQGCYVTPEGEAVDDYPGDYLDENQKPQGARIGIQIPTLEGLMLGVENDWIIKGVQGEVYPCKPDIFEATYESAEERPV